MARRRQRAARARRLRPDRRPNLYTQILLVAPLFLLYQVGAFRSDRLNGVDFVSRLLFRLRATSEWALLGLAAVMVVAVIYLYRRQSRREQFQWRMMLPLLLESGLYAVALGGVILLFMEHVLGLRPPTMATDGGRAMSAWMVIYVSAGAGLHEELVFRVGILGGLAALLLRWTGLGRALALTVALLASAALFSAAHHVPPHGEPFTAFAFVYRLLAGVLFGIIYLRRGFATAVYTHFLYDVLVLGALGAG